MAMDSEVKEKWPWTTVKSESRCERKERWKRALSLLVVILVLAS
jgi:hypothetical protein